VLLRHGKQKLNLMRTGLFVVQEETVLLFRSPQPHLPLYSNQPVPATARSKALVYGLSPTATVGSNPTDHMDVCLLCVLSGRSLCDELITRPEESYRL
jgi:hypothetical protein